MASKTLEDKLIDKMYELEEQYRRVLEVRARNRSSLRDLAAQDLLSAEQVAQIEEVYPRRASNSDEAIAA